MMTALLLTLPGGNSLPGALFLAGNPASLGLKCDFKRGLVTQNSIIFHPQTEEVDEEKADSKSHFLELHSTPRESGLKTREGKEVHSGRPRHRAYHSWISASGHRE